MDAARSNYLHKFPDQADLPTEPRDARARKMLFPPRAIENYIACIALIKCTGNIKARDFHYSLRAAAPRWAEPSRLTRAVFHSPARRVHFSILQIIRLLQYYRWRTQLQTYNVHGKSKSIARWIIIIRNCSVAFTRVFIVQFASLYTFLINMIVENRNDNPICFFFNNNPFQDFEKYQIIILYKALPPV